MLGDHQRVMISCQLPPAPGNTFSGFVVMTVLHAGEN
jgi:hypothetical protein